MSADASVSSAASTTGRPEASHDSDSPTTRSTRTIVPVCLACKPHELLPCQVWIYIYKECRRLSATGNRSRQLHQVAALITCMRKWMSCNKKLPCAASRKLIPPVLLKASTNVISSRCAMQHYKTTAMAPSRPAETPVCLLCMIVSCPTSASRLNLPQATERHTRVLTQCGGL